LDCVDWIVLIDEDCVDWIVLIDEIFSFLYSVHVRTRKFMNLEKQSHMSYRHQGATQKRKAEQESTRIQSATAITLFFQVF